MGSLPSRDCSSCQMSAPPLHTIQSSSCTGTPAPCKAAGCKPSRQLCMVQHPTLGAQHAMIAAWHARRTDKFPLEYCQNASNALESTIVDQNSGMAGCVSHTSSALRVPEKPSMLTTPMPRSEAPASLRILMSLLSSGATADTRKLPSSATAVKRLRLSLTGCPTAHHQAL